MAANIFWNAGANFRSDEELKIERILIHKKVQNYTKIMHILVSF